MIFQRMRVTRIGVKVLGRLKPAVCMLCRICRTCLMCGGEQANEILANAGPIRQMMPAEIDLLCKRY